MRWAFCSYYRILTLWWHVGKHPHSAALWHGFVNFGANIAVLLWELRASIKSGGCGVDRVGVILSLPGVSERGGVAVPPAIFLRKVVSRQHWNFR